MPAGLLKGFANSGSLNIFAGLHMARGLIDHLAAKFSFFDHQKLALSLNDGGHREMYFIGHV